MIKIRTENYKLNDAFMNWIYDTCFLNWFVIHFVHKSNQNFYRNEHQLPRRIVYNELKKVVQIEVIDELRER